MAHSLSAKKRIRQNESANARNRWRKRRIKHAVKQFDSAIHDGQVDAAEEAYRAVSKTLDQVAAKGTIHPKKAARTKSRLAARINAMKSASA